MLLDRSDSYSQVFIVLRGPAAPKYIQGSVKEKNQEILERKEGRLDSYLSPGGQTRVGDKSYISIRTRWP
jgi:hypothetical protein